MKNIYNIGKIFNVQIMYVQSEICVSLNSKEININLHNKYGHQMNSSYCNEKFGKCK